MWDLDNEPKDDEYLPGDVDDLDEFGKKEIDEDNSFDNIPNDVSDDFDEEIPEDDDEIDEPKVDPGVSSL